MPNPFHHRQAITDTACFHGRSALVRSVLEMVASGQSCALVGERRLGKSSFLRYLAAVQVRSAHGLEPKTLAIYLDFLAFHTASPEDLWAEIADALSAASDEAEVSRLLGPLAERGQVAFVELRRALRKLSRLGFRSVLLCDEFEFAVQNPRFDVGFFGALRSLAGGEGVIFVTASRLSLFELDQYRGEEARRKILGSPFFNIFAELELGPFEDHEVAELLAASLEPTPIRFDADDVAFLDRIAGRHPYFLQLAAYHLYAALERASTSRRAMLRAGVRDEVAREAAKIFRNQWQHGSDEENEVLLALSAGRELRVEASSPPGLGRSTLDHLERRGLIRRIGERRREVDSTTTGHPLLERYRLFSDLFGDWIRAQTAAETPRKQAEISAGQGAEGATLPPRYEVLEEIGQGGAGSVFKAWDGRLERVVAIKALDHTLREDPARLERLLAEARICAALNHPSIVTVYDVDVEHGCLIEEFLPGGSLRDVLDRGRMLSNAGQRSLAQQLASALVAAHGAGVVHRDLKPENVLLTALPGLRDPSPLPAVKLADFGTALHLRCSSQDRGTIAGTLAYMAPEQRVGEEAKPTADIFALGVLLYETRHGCRPGGVPLFTPAPDDALEALLERCLRPRPEERFASAEQFLETLVEASGDRPGDRSQRGV